MAKKIKFNYFRLIIQWTITGLLAYMVGRWFFDKSYTPDFEAYCPFGGIQAFSSWYVNNSLACSMTSMQIAMGILLMIGIFIFSKLFCGYVCPIGTFTEWLGKLGSTFKIRFTITGFADRALRILKYALFFITVYFTVGSSELFCKKYDPFYASFTGFSGDVVLWMGLTSIVITILGSVFIRQFWCKYLCPLAAVSNIFSFILMFIGVIGIYLLLGYFGITISWVIPLAVISVLGFIFEAFSLKSRFSPFFRITRQDDVCTHCKLCDKACPQGILISQGDEKIRHIDCNLCANCITVCPHKGALKINRFNLRWLPPVAVIILVVAGLYLGRTTEVPTVDERWGTEEQMSQAKTFEKSGLKEIKCFGSSMGFVSQMKQINGVLGVATYVGSHTVKIYYDPNVLTEEKLIEYIFSPLLYILQKPDTTLNEVQILTLGIEKFFDKYDAFYLRQLLSQNAGIYGIETKYGEPVMAKIYFDEKVLNPEKIKAIIESPELTFEMRGKKQTQPLNFTVAFIDEKIETMGSKEFEKHMYEPYKNIFNNFENYNDSLILLYEIPMPQSADPDLAGWIPYLEYHISVDTGIVGIETKFTGDFPVADIIFVKNLTTPENILKSLKSDSLTITYTDGTVEKFENPFMFEVEGSVIKNEE